MNDYITRHQKVTAYWGWLFHEYWLELTYYLELR